MAELGDGEPSYIDYETFLAPEFDPSSFANSLVLSTNDPNDTPLDLTTPLSRVLFDIQEIDSHIDLLTARAAVPLLTHTKDQTQTSSRVIADLEAPMKSLNDSYQQLEKQVIQKHTEADEVRQVALRLWQSLRLGRAIGRCLQLGRQLEVQHGEFSAATVAAPPPAGSALPASDGASAKQEDHRFLVRCAHTILSLREIVQQKAPGQEGHGLDKVEAIRTLQDTVVAPTEKAIRETADRTIREFALGSSVGSMSFSQSEEGKARTVSALVALFLISPTNIASAAARGEPWSPTAMIQALETYLRAALQSSVTALARSLAALPTLDRTLAEVSARCQNIVALEQLLASTKAPSHPLRALLSITPAATENNSLLQPLLAKLETGSLPSYFWRTLAGHLSPRVQDIVTRGGVAARTLRTNKANVSDSIRECVIRGMQPAADGGIEKNGAAAPKKTRGSKLAGWDREIAVMVGSVTAHLGR